jgi:hypothetical protein
LLPTNVVKKGWEVDGVGTGSDLIVGVNVPFKYADMCLAILLALNADVDIGYALP